MPKTVHVFCKVAGIAGSAVCWASVAQGAVPAPAPAWNAFMPAEVIGARSFVQAHPHLDGRGLVVAVLDTGVDPLATGLQRTSTGAPKVIEARDFTGQGDVQLERAAVVDSAGKRTAQAGDVALAGLDTLKEPPFDGEYWLGAFREGQIGPPELRDWNHSGTPDDRLALLVWRTGPGADDFRALLDANHDRDATGDAIVRPFHVAQELLLPPLPQPQRDVAQLSLAFEPDLGRKLASLHFTDGSHGTHVAGIITGVNVFGKPGWDGVAPGAQVLSLKIGHNARAGGATPTESFQRALQFAADWARRSGRPLVVNASYGVGAGAEREAAIDKIVDDLVAQSPGLTCSFSAGNDGPGISSVGTPAAADLALAVGALVPRDSVPTLYGGKVAGHEMFAFSSRGGDLGKPEVVAPGVAATSVPIWDGREVKNGTSMAAPHVAGAMLLVWAALLHATDARLLQPTARLPTTLHGGLVRRGLVGSAQPIAGYGLLDQGHGLIDVGRAAELATRLARRGEAQATLGYRLETAVPRGDGSRPPSNYWRTGPLPSWPDLTIKTEVRAILPSTSTAVQREAFSAVYDLRADADWVELVRPQVLLRADRPMPFEVRLKPAKLTAPGVHVARITGREAGAKDDEVAFEAWQVVVVPQRPGPGAGGALRFANVAIAPGKVWRTWVQVPPGSGQVRVTAARRSKTGVSAATEFADVFLAVFDPDGRRLRPAQRTINSTAGTDAEWTEHGKRLVPGVWELTLAGNLAAAQDSHVDVDVLFTGARVQPIERLAAKSGGLPEATATVTNLWGDPFVGKAKGTIGRAVKRDKATAKDDVHTWKVALGPLYAGARVRFEVDRETYDRCTDIAITVKDGTGSVVAETAFHGPEAEVEWRKPAGRTEGTYTVEVAPGFARPRKDPWKITADLALDLVRKVSLDVKAPAGPGGAAALWAFPNVPVKLEVKATEPLPQAPDGFELAGEVELWSADGRTKWLTVPIGDE
ncbi:MAG: hypothetical protein EXR79_06665 [Myxococcales bacterium]|nr:hypothetical protein [Myxococcales bacterium]